MNNDLQYECSAYKAFKHGKDTPQNSFMHSCSFMWGLHSLILCKFRYNMTWMLHTDLLWTSEELRMPSTFVKTAGFLMKTSEISALRSPCLEGPPELQYWGTVPLANGTVPSPLVWGIYAGTVPFASGTVPQLEVAVFRRVIGRMSSNDGVRSLFFRWSRCNKTNNLWTMIYSTYAALRKT